jgi:hypothetical protein
MSIRELNACLRIFLPSGALPTCTNICIDSSYLRDHGSNVLNHWERSISTFPPDNRISAVSQVYESPLPVYQVDT